MNKFDSIDTISIRKTNGLHNIRINGNKVTPFDSNGAFFLASEIEAVLVQDLGYFHPIVVEFDETYTKKAKLNHIQENIITSMTIMGENIVETFVTFMDPADIDENGLHEKFQTTLEKVVEEEKNILLYQQVRRIFSKKELKLLKSASKKFTDSSPVFSYSEIGYVQFTVHFQANTFNEVFRDLDQVIARIDKSTRALIKKDKS